MNVLKVTCGKRDFADVIKNTEMGEISLDYLVEPNVTTKDLIGGRQEVRDGEGDVMMELWSWKKAEGATSQGMQETSISWKRQGNGFSSKTSKKNVALPTPWF